MNKLTLSLLALLALCAAAFARASAQTVSSLVGTYQGTLALSGDKGLRTVVKLSKDDHEALKAVFYSIDQTPQPIPVDTISLSGSNLNFRITALDVTYTGKVSPDSATITGNFSQGGKAFPLNLVRTAPDTAWTIPEPPTKIPPMPADAKPVFEVATIKPSDPAVKGKLFRVNGRHVSTINTSLSDLIVFAYGIQQKQIIGAPEWVKTDHYDLSAQPDLEGAPSSDQWKSMVKLLLSDRFKLAFHQDKRELSVYALELGKTEPKLKKSENQDTVGSLLFRGQKDGGLLLPGRSSTMTDFTNVMQAAVLDRPVVDHTGLTARYDFNLSFTPDETMMGGVGGMPLPPADAADAAPNLFAAIQEQMGLKLEAIKAPVGVFVIDHVEKPSDN